MLGVANQRKHTQRTGQQASSPTTRAMCRKPRGDCARRGSAASPASCPIPPHRGCQAKVPQCMAQIARTAWHALDRNCLPTRHATAISTNATSSRKTERSAGEIHPKAWRSNKHSWPRGPRPKASVTSTPPRRNCAISPRSQASTLEEKPQFRLARCVFETSASNKQTEQLGGMSSEANFASRMRRKKPPFEANSRRFIGGELRGRRNDTWREV